MRVLRAISRWLLGIFFLFSGLNHFLHTDFYLRIMPPYLPWHLALVRVSGVCESALGLLLLAPGTARFASLGLVALLLAVFPANIHMSLHPEAYPEFGSTALWVRLPLQFLLMAWVYWSGRSRRW